MNGDLPAPAARPSVVHLLAEAAEQFPDAEALVDGETRLTYRDYFARVRAFAAELRPLGVGGRRVATVLGNSADTCIVFFAVHLAGAQLVPLNPLYTEREVREILSDADPVLLVADSGYRESLGLVAHEVGIGHCIWLGEHDRRLRDQPLPSPGGEPAPALPAPDAAALLQYTGGTTGVPKGVELTHGAIASNVAQRDDLLPTHRGRERVLCVMPLFHSYAMSMALYLAANSAGCLVILSRYQPARLLDTVAEERITLFPGNPTIFTGLLAHPGSGTADWSSVRMCYSGSAALPVETLRRFERMVGAPVVEGYGQTEAGPVLTFNPADGVRKPGSVGVPVAGTTVQVVALAEPGGPVAAGQQGEIRARGPQIMTGYLNRPVETAEALRDGWLYTGDIGEFDEDGYLFIRDRRKELVIVSGYNVYPREVEEVLFTHPAVVDAAVIGVPDEYRGEILQAFVVLGAASATTPEELSEYCRANLARYKVPARVDLVAALPKTTINKTDKTALRESLRP